MKMILKILSTENWSLEYDLLNACQVSATPDTVQLKCSWQHNVFPFA